MQQQEMFLWDKLETNYAPHKNVLPPLAGSLQMKMTTALKTRHIVA